MIKQVRLVIALIRNPIKKYFLWKSKRDLRNYYISVLIEASQNHYTKHILNKLWKKDEDINVFLSNFNLLIGTRFRAIISGEDRMLLDEVQINWDNTNVFGVSKRSSWNSLSDLLAKTDDK